MGITSIALSFSQSMQQCIAAERSWQRSDYTLTMCFACCFTSCVTHSKAQHCSAPLHWTWQVAHSSCPPPPKLQWCQTCLSWDPSWFSEDSGTKLWTLAVPWFYCSQEQCLVMNPYLAKLGLREGERCSVLNLHQIRMKGKDPKQTQFY